MALTPFVTSLLAEQIKPGARVASMGYPDIVADPALIAAILGDRLPQLQYRPDSPAIAKWHGLPAGRQVPDAHSFFGLLGSQLDVFDVAELRGGEIIADLNQQIDKRHLGVYDFVLDVGTLEHCFNIAQAGINMARLLKAGGIIYHTNPYNSGNHGFYGINPTWYADFYSQPGFKLLRCNLFQREAIYEVPHTGRFKCAVAEVNAFAAAMRTELRPVEFVIQTKYKALLGKQVDICVD